MFHNATGWAPPGARPLKGRSMNERKFHFPGHTAPMTRAEWLDDGDTPPTMEGAEMGTKAAKANGIKVARKRAMIHVSIPMKQGPANRTAMIKALLVQNQFKDDEIFRMVQTKFGDFKRAEIATARHALNTGITGKTMMQERGLAHIKRIG